MAEEEKTTDEVIEEQNVTVEEPKEPEIPDSASVEAADEMTKKSDPSDELPKKPNIFKRFLAAYTAKKKLFIPLTIVVLLAMLFAIPLTRYNLLGLVIKKNIDVTILDSQTNIPVSGVHVSLRGKSATTDGQGKATIKGVKVGKGQLTAAKKYYQDTSSSVTAGLKPKGLQLKLVATGRQIPIRVTNSINGKDIADATIKAADTEAKTDQNGATTIVLPADKSSIDATVTAAGFNEAKITISIDDPTVKANTFALVPSGKLYFLSKKTGTIDVVKTDLDGSNRQTVLAGTGNEEEANTILLASRDWKYLALLSRRDNSPAKLYLIDTSSDKLTEMDSGNASFTLTGWSDHNFVYQVLRNDVANWQPNGAALKSYNAETQQITVIDQTGGEGSGDNDYAREYIDHAYILKNTIVYTKTWSVSYYSANRLAGKRMGIYSAASNGGNKQLLKDFDQVNYAYFSVVASKPDELYVSRNDSSGSTYFEYEDGKLSTASDINADSFAAFYPTFLVSPSGQATFWYEPRDGKNTLFTGKADGDGKNEVASLSEYTPYGWYTDNYLLVSKNSSELYILAADSQNAADHILKVSDYHKPNYNFTGYGGGYGGF